MNLLDLANKIQNKNNNFSNISSINDCFIEVLAEYKRICDNLDYDYEFHCVDDIFDNDSVTDICSFVEKNL